jgi:hypothetical protein
VAVVLTELHGGVLYGAAHPLNMALGPRMVRLWEPVFDAICLTDHVEGLKWSQKTGQSAKVYPKPLKGYENGEAPELYRPV